MDRNNFGALSEQYDKARRGYPREVFQYLRTLSPKKEASVLDIGCGTGIATRQLKQYKFNVTGADKDALMLKTARKKGEGIRYVTAPAHKLPFKDAQFDVVTAFTAFHWFTDARSIREIKRVLKPGGMFFTCIKRSSGKKRWSKVAKAYIGILDRYAGKNIDSAKDHDPEGTLRQNGFERIKKRSFYFDEIYSLKDALLLQTSLSHWHLIPNKLKAAFLKDLEGLYKRSFPRGRVIRDRKVEIVAGYLAKRS